MASIFELDVQQWICRGQKRGCNDISLKGMIAAVQVDRLALEAEHVGDPSIAPRDQALSALQGTPSWRSHPVALFLPPDTPPTKALPFHPHH